MWFTQLCGAGPCVVEALNVLLRDSSVLFRMFRSPPKSTSFSKAYNALSSRMPDRLFAISAYAI